MDSFGFFAGIAVLLWAISGFPGLSDSASRQAVLKLAEEIDKTNARIEKLEKANGTQ